MGGAAGTGRGLANTKTRYLPPPQEKRRGVKICKYPNFRKTKPREVSGERETREGSKEEALESVLGGDGPGETEMGERNQFSSHLWSPQVTVKWSESVHVKNIPKQNMVLDDHPTSCSLTL